eukprot:11187655-Lingulodinium_polyedra.AAC.1
MPPAPSLPSGVMFATVPAWASRTAVGDGGEETRNGLPRARRVEQRAPVLGRPPENARGRALG